MATICQWLPTASVLTLVVLILTDGPREVDSETNIKLEWPGNRVIVLNDNPDLTCGAYVDQADQPIPTGYRVTSKAMEIRLSYKSVGDDDPMICNVNNPIEDATWYAHSRHYGRYKVILNIASYTRVLCHFYMENLKDGEYKCSLSYEASFFKLYDEHKCFNIITTRYPDKFVFVRDGSLNESYLTTMDVYEGEHKSITCVLFNVKPLYQVRWTSNYGVVTENSATTNSHSISCVALTARFLVSWFLHGKIATCRAERIDEQGLRHDIRFAHVQLNVIHGPQDENLIIRSRKERLTIVCPLKSNPAITYFVWMRNNSLLRCSLRRCTFHLDDVRNSTLSCEGRNPKTGVRGKANIRVVRTR